MVVLRRYLGCCMNLPEIYFEPSLLKESNMLVEMLYDKKSDYYYKNFNINFIYESNPKMIEYRMRGYLITNQQASQSDQWRYIQIDKAPLSNALCSKLVRIPALDKEFPQILYGKKDGFLHNVPLECLLQFYDQYRSKEVEAIFSESCSFIIPSQINKELKTLVSDKLTCKDTITCLHQAGIFYLEELIVNAKAMKRVTRTATRKQVEEVLAFTVRMMSEGQYSA